MKLNELQVFGLVYKLVGRDHLLLTGCSQRLYIWYPRSGVLTLACACQAP